jgi:hypothetical protein
VAVPSPIGEAFGVSVAEMKAPSREGAARSLGRAAAYRRRHHFGGMLGSCAHPLGAVVGPPGHSRHSNGLRVKALGLAAAKEARLSGRKPSFLPRGRKTVGRAPAASPGRGYGERIGCGTGTTGMPLASRKLFGSIEHGGARWAGTEGCRIPVNLQN